MSPDQFKGFGNHRQIAQTQKIKFDQTDLFDNIHVELGHHFPLFASIKWKIVNQRPVGNDHSGGMGGGMARQSLEHPTDPYQVGHVGVFFSQLRQPRFLFEGAIEADIQYIRHHFGNRIHFPQGDAQRSAHIADDGPGFEFPESNDLGHIITAAIFIDHVLIHIFPAVYAKIHIDVRHAFTGRVEKAFKN